MKRFLTAVIVSLVLTVPSVEAHPGRTDSSGGHNCNVGSCAGTYHYHNGGSSSSPPPAPKPVAPPPAPSPTPTVTPNTEQRVLQQQTTKPAQTAEPAKSNSSCFIATAAYGTPFASEIDELREFRDEVLLTNRLGKTFVSNYYRYSPPVADVIEENDALRWVVREQLRPVIAVLNFTEPIWK